jgi:hypothetical protein
MLHNIVMQVSLFRSEFQSEDPQAILQRPWATLKYRKYITLPHGKRYTVPVPYLVPATSEF